MMQNLDRNQKRKRRHLRVRKKIIGTPERPRLNVFRSAKNIYAQLIDDQSGITLVSASTVEKDGAKEQSGSTVSAARNIGNLVAKRALEKGYQAVVFDRGGYVYHGRIKALAEGAREGGLDF